jgi:hypothetical protein
VTIGAPATKHVVWAVLVVTALWAAPAFGGGGGWYLLEPGLEPGTPIIPISAWKHRASFDSAAACEKEKARLVTKAMNELREVQEKLVAPHGWDDSIE